MKFPQTKILGLALSIVGLVMCGFGLSLLLSPAQYRATAIIKINSDMEDVGSLNSQPSYDPYFIQTDFEIIRSQIVLGDVVTNLNLNALWSKKYFDGKPLKTDEVVKIMQDHLLLAPVYNTRLILISYTSTDPTEAAEIANAIVSAYSDYRIKSRLQLATVGLKAMQEQYQDEERQIQAMQTNVDELRSHFSVVGDPTGSWGQAYPEAKYKLDQLIDQHRLFLAKINARKIDAATPKNSLVQIMDPAMPPKFPIGPNRFLGGALLAVGFILALGGILLLQPKK